MCQIYTWAALSEGDYVHQAIAHADVIVSIGHDTIEKPPFLMKNAGGCHVIHFGYQSANVEQVYHPDAEVIGDIAATVRRLADRLEGKLQLDPSMLALRDP